MKTLYVADLDGTLFSDNALLTQNTLNILNGLIDKGLMFTIATARSIASVSTLLKDLNIRLPVSLMNGVFSYDLQNKKALQYYHIEEECFKEAVEVFKKHGLAPFFYLYSDDGLEVQYTRLDNPESQNFYETRRVYYYKRFYKVNDLHITKGTRGVYLNALAKYKDLQPLTDDFAKIKGLQTTIYNDTSENTYYFEVFSKDAGKGSGIENLKKLSSADKLIVFGDNYNDIPMFEVADESYAMANAISELKDIATATIAKNTEDGVASFIKEHFKTGL